MSHWLGSHISVCTQFTGQIWIYSVYRPKYEFKFLPLFRPLSSPQFSAPCEQLGWLKIMPFSMNFCPGCRNKQSVKPRSPPIGNTSQFFFWCWGQGRTTGDHVVQLDLKAGLASVGDQVAQVPFRTALEISKEGDSPASGGNLCYSYPLSIWCYIFQKEQN